MIIDIDPLGLGIRSTRGQRPLVAYAKEAIPDPPNDELLGFAQGNPAARAVVFGIGSPHLYVQYTPLLHELGVHPLITGKLVVHPHGGQDATGEGSIHRIHRKRGTEVIGGKGG